MNNGQENNLIQANAAENDENFSGKLVSEELELVSSKARIRINYRDVFIRAMSRFSPMIRVPTYDNASSRFMVCARVRPFLQHESHRLDVYDSVTVRANTVTVHAGNLRLNKCELKSTTFRFDAVFGTSATNQDVYHVVRQAIIRSIPQKNTTPIDSNVFLYGKTGTGKSYTISGITENFVEDLFNLLKQTPYEVRIGISAVEIVAGTKGFIVSRDNVCDLYNNGTLVYFRDDMQGTVHLRGAKEHACNTSSELDTLIKKAMIMRRTRTTTRNYESSRSHLIYFIRIRRAADILEEGDILSTITFVDLAGNEGQQDTLYHKGASDQVKDATSINRSLASLQQCISAAANQSKVIPFRGSVLTRILKKCFCSSETKTVFIGTISGLPMDAEQSVQTLRYTGLIKWPIEDFMIEKTVRLDAALGMD